MYRTTMNAIVGLGVMFGSASLARAQIVIPPAPPAPTPMPATGPAGKMTCAGLVQMLNECGFQPQLKADNQGNQFLSLTVTLDGWKFPLIVDVSPSGRKVWLQVAAKQFAVGDTIPQDRLLDLLDPAKQPGTGHFCYRKATREVLFLANLDSRGLTPTDLQREVMEFVTLLKENAAVWNIPAQVGR